MPNWIRVANEVHDDPQIVAMAAELGVDPFKLVGHFVALWARMSAHSKRGIVENIHDKVLESWARWDGPPNIFASRFREHFAPAGRVKNWDRYNGKPLRDAEIDAKRKRDARRRTSVGRSTGRPPDSPRTGAGPAGVRTDGRTDGRTNKEKPSARGAEPVLTWVQEATTMYRTIGKLSFGRIGKALKPLVDEFQWDAPHDSPKGHPDHVRRWWGAYCRTRPAEANGRGPVGPEHFVATYQQWRALAQPALELQ